MRKGQAAMEFLMTYGWAILVVLVAIGALAYFGVLSPARFLPASCTIAPGLGCGEFKVTPSVATTDNVKINIVNGMGAAITPSALSLTPAIGSCTLSTTLAAISDGATKLMEWECTLLSLDDRFKGEISMTYLKSGETLTHTVKGTIVTKVEPV